MANDFRGLVERFIELPKAPTCRCLPLSGSGATFIPSCGICCMTPQDCAAQTQIRGLPDANQGEKSEKLFNDFNTTRRKSEVKGQ